MPLTTTYLGFPRNAAWCRALKPLLLAIVRSAWNSSSRVIISSLFLLMASWRGVSPSESYRGQERSKVCHVLYNFLKVLL